MLASDLIAHLQEQVANFGDREIVVRIDGAADEALGGHWHAAANVLGTSSRSGDKSKPAGEITQHVITIDGKYRKIGK